MTSPRTAPPPMANPAVQKVAPPPAPPAVQKVQSLMLAYKEAITQALPKHLTTERLMRLCLTELRRVPKLQECDAMSFVGCVIQAAQLGLEPGAALGQCYLIPRKAECTLLIGYRGMVSLARRSGEILSISARAVYEGDDFRPRYGTHEQILHTPMFASSVMTHVYAVAQLKGGGFQFDIMSLPEVEHVRKTYASDRSDAWKDSYDEMAKKTVVRRLFKLLPACVELADALAHEESDQRNHATIDASYTPVEAKPDVAKIISNWEEPAAVTAMADITVAKQLLWTSLNQAVKRGATQADITPLFEGKNVSDWEIDATLPEIYAAIERVNNVKPKGAAS